MTWSERMRDAAMAGNIGLPFDGAIAGYLAGGDPYHPWTPLDWDKFPRNRKLPIFVQTNAAGAHPWTDADGVVRQLVDLNVPKGCYTVLDLDGAVAPDYVEGYGDALHLAGYKTWVYGSISTLFRNPPLNGYWAADYRGAGPFMVPADHVRATQYADPNTGSGGDWDSSTILDWVYWSDSWWR
jgi:hypothetical protein